MPAKRVLRLSFSNLNLRRLTVSPGREDERILDSDDPTLFDIQTQARGPAGRVPINAELLRHSPSGNLFAFSQNAGMGWDPSELGRREFLILSTQGGIRAADGRPIALGYHTGHWEVGLLMKAAAEEISAANCIPFAAYCTDPCDGRTQGTPGHDGQPALPQRCSPDFSEADSLPADPEGSPGGCHLRQRASGHDDGSCF